jgi:cobalt-zinc-cadmium efflux system membrane fusion protein
MKAKSSIILFIFCFLALGYIVSINGCSDKSEAEMTGDEHSVQSEEKGHEEEQADEIALTDEQIKFMGIQTQNLDYQNISGYIKVNGEVTMNPDNESKVGSLISGRIKKIYVKEGSFVRAGQTLAIIENPELINIQVEYIHAKNEYEYSKLEYERQLKLSKDNIGSKKTLSELEAKYKNALANYKTHEEKLTVYKISKQRFDNIYEDTSANLQRYYSVASPISGNVVSRMATIGQFVEPSTDLFHIVNTSTVYADLSIFEKDLPFVSIGQKVKLELNVNPYEIYEGEISYINKVFDDKNRTVKVRVAINNKNGKLLPFMFITAKIYINANSVLAVPISALETEGENKYIFIRTNETIEIESHSEHYEDKGENKNIKEKESGIVFKKVTVNTGISDDRFVEIFPIDDLKSGDEIVVNGTFYLKSELKKGELEGHDD